MTIENLPWYLASKSKNGNQSCNFLERERRERSIAVNVCIIHFSNGELKGGEENQKLKNKQKEQQYLIKKTKSSLFHYFGISLTSIDNQMHKRALWRTMSVIEKL